MTSETDEQFVERLISGKPAAMIDLDRLFALARRGAAVTDQHAIGFREGAAHMHKAQADRIEQLEAALRWINEECTALMKLPEGENVETQTGYSRGIYFTAKHIQTRAALKEGDGQ